MDGHAFRDLVSGTRQDWVGRLCRPLLATMALPYGWVVAGRNQAYQRGWLRQHWAGVPVVSVGNLTLGGTGKTPLVAWIARWCQQHGRHPAILSRGYRAHSDGTNDEAREMAARLGPIPQVQQKDRVAGARIAITQHQADVLILDDGFQHQRIHRQLDLVLLDALCPWGYGHLFPRGTLREPLSSLRRADVICLSRADAVSSEARRQICQIATQLAPQATWAELTHRPQTLLNVNGTTEPLTRLRGARVAAFCGIGNPNGFRHTLESLGCELVAWREYPDHFGFADRSRDELASWVEKQPPPDLLVCTHKDLVKLKSSHVAGIPLFALTIDCEFLQGEADFVRLLAQALSPVP